MRSVIIGTAGHIDHGKTALIYALTGTDTDRLPEEKRRGITIDLGFAMMRVADAQGGRVQLSFIDVPGHHAFVRNMLAGTGGIDCALLVIGANEGVKAQTEEHLAICSLLGIQRGLVVLTKKDAVSAERLEQTRRNAVALLTNTFLDDAPMLAVSAKTGEGLAELRDALAALAASVPPRSQDFLPRMYPDRAFSMHGFGTVVTGTLQSGEMRVGDTLALEPGGCQARVRGMQVHGTGVAAASAPCRVALNLADIEPRDIQRGQALMHAGTLITTTLVDAEVSLMPGAPVLKHRSRVRFHAFTADIGATVLLYDAESLRGGASALVRFQLERPFVLAPGDRFVMRAPSPAATVGGGRVLDTIGGRGVRKANALQWLRRLQGADIEEQLALRVERHDSRGASIKQLTQETGIRGESIQKILRPLIARQSAVARNTDMDKAVEFVVSANALSKSEAAMLEHIAQAKNGSISRAELRSRCRLTEPIFDMALERLANTGKIEGGDVLALHGHSSLIDSRLERHASEIEREYLKAGIAPPLLLEVSGRLKISPTDLREAMTLLLRSKRLARLGSDDLYIHCDAVAKLSAGLAAHRGEAFDVGRFKSFTGLTRKHAIPLLEYLDRAHITRNVAGTRIVI
jgi:selenocysteine-specific elongation factor